MAPRLTRRDFGAGLLAVPAALAAPSMAAPSILPRSSGRPGPTPFALGDVRLGAGPFADARDWNRDYLTRLDVDRLLHVFLVNAGLPSDAAPLGGWEAPRCELRGHFVGHYLSALAIGWAATGDAALRARGERMVRVLERCQAALGGDGYLSAFPREFFDRLATGQKVWAPFYTLHKIMAGLLDQHRLAGDPVALRVVRGMADWVDAWTAARDVPAMQEVLKVEFGGMGEVLYDLAAVTGDERFLRTGDRFIKNSFVDPLARRQDALQGLHANTHIPQALAVARRFELGGGARLHDAATFFRDTVVEARSYVTGGTSAREHWESPPHALATEWRATAEHQECCCAYNMLKLTRRLFSWQPEARHMDYYERVLFNHRLGTIEPQTGRTLYFLSLSPGAWKAPGLETDTFWCCNGTAIEEFGRLGDTIYYRDAEDVWLNLFVASKLTWAERGIELTQDTRFPVEPRTTFTINRTPRRPWTLRVRIPGWTSAARILVNGAPLDVPTTPGTYASVRRRWRAGDRVEIELPMSLRREALPDDPSIEAYLYGPVVLAGQFAKGEVPPDGDRMKAPDLVAAPFNVPELPVGDRPLESWLVRDEARLFSWQTRGLSFPLRFEPLYTSWDRYAVYWQTV